MYFIIVARTILSYIRAFQVEWVSKVTGFRQRGSVHTDTRECLCKNTWHGCKIKDFEGSTFFFSFLLKFLILKT